MSLIFTPVAKRCRRDLAKAAAWNSFAKAAGLKDDGLDVATANLTLDERRRFTKMVHELAGLLRLARASPRRSFLTPFAARPFSCVSFRWKTGDGPPLVQGGEDSHDDPTQCSRRRSDQSHRRAQPPARQAYLARIDAAVASGPARKRLGCANFAHGFAACATGDKEALREGGGANLAIVTAYNDMLSAHQPYARFPDLIKEAARAAGGSAQVAGGVPAMCDGVTQGEAGMELSLFSRDVIALSTAVALSHNMFDAAVYLGICDKIVPGLLIGALSFGHLPAVFLPAGPMPSGLANDEKSKIRQLYAEGKATRADLLASRGGGLSRAWHLHLLRHRQHQPDADGDHGPAPAGRVLRQSEYAAARRADRGSASSGRWRSLRTAINLRRSGACIDERAVVNGVVGLHATGGSTNHTIHLIAMAAAAGITLTWEDFSDLAEVTPLLARVYPNGKADVNHFHAAGGMGFLIRELLDAGLAARRCADRLGRAARRLRGEPRLGEDGDITWAPAAARNPATGTCCAARASRSSRPAACACSKGRSAGRSSRPRPSRRSAILIEAPARVFHSQEELHAAFKAGELDRDFVAVVRFQGPKAIGMPELHKLMPPLGVLQDRGHKVALVTDGRLSGRFGQGALGDPCHARGGGGRRDRQDPRRRCHPARCAGRPARGHGRG